MDHHHKSSSQRSSGSGRAAAEPAAAAAVVRTRWTPKPEQILILESIFNSGMVNPRKDETVKIRKLLEQFGAVGDANIFYWFQNRRSRARRSQRQLQASAQLVSAATSKGGPAAQLAPGGSGGVNNLYEPTSSSSTMTSNNYHGGGGGGLMFPSAANYCCNSCSNNSTCSNVSVTMDDSADDLFSITRQIMGFMESATAAPAAAPPPPPFVCSSDLSQLHHQSTGSSTSSVMVFIDGVLSEVPRGPIDLRSAFGQNVMLLHYSGELLPVDERGILTHGLQMGESYFLVTKPN